MTPEPVTPEPRPGEDSAPDLDPDSHPDADPESETTAATPKLGSPFALLRLRRRWLWLGMSVLAVLAILSLLLWWFDRPAPPLEELLHNNSPDAEQVDPELDGDAEQLAFLERRAEAPADLDPFRLEGEAVDGASDSQTGDMEARGPAITLTDRDLIRQLAGRWILDLGGGRVAADFAPVAVDRVRRGALLVELFPVASQDLPPFYTAFELPDQGTFIAFRAADGGYRLVLEDVRTHGSDLLSYRVGSSPQRRNAYRVQSSADRRSSGDSGDFGDEAPRSPRRDESSAPVEIRVEAAPSASEMWSQAQSLRQDERFDTLAIYLDRMLAAHPTHSGARRWRARTDAWIRSQHKELASAVKKRLENLAEAISDRDEDDIFEQWDDHPDAQTRTFFIDLLSRHPRLEARVTLQSVSVRDGVADFAATLTVEGSSGRLRDTDITTYSFRGQLRGEYFVTPFL